MPVLHSRGGDDRRKASSYRRAFGGQPSFSASRDSKGLKHTFASPFHPTYLPVFLAWFWPILAN